MAQVTLKGNPFNTSGDLPAAESKAPQFTLTKIDLSDISSQDLAGKTLVLNIFPSIDTPVCAASVRKFNADASKLDNTEVLCISQDLPFALKRFCGAEGLDKVTPASAFRNPQFGKDFGVQLTEGPMKGLFARAVVVVGPDGTVKYTQLVPEIAEEPDYEAALKAI